MRTRIATLLVAAAALGGCGYNGLGLGVGYGSPYGGYYDPYYGGGYGYGGYGSGIRIGYGSYGGYGRYGYGSPYGYGGYGYGMPYWGWYNNWYYPGTGYYVYDRYRNRQVWTDAQKRYWTERLKRAQSRNGVTKMPNTQLSREIWTDFNRPQTTTSVTTQSVTRSPRTVRTRSVAVDRPSRSERIQSSESRRAERQSARSTRSSERRRSRDD
jgi:hypothetical protein